MTHITVSTIANDLCQGQPIVTIQAGDFAIKIGGTIAPA